MRDTALFLMTKSPNFILAAFRLIKLGQSSDQFDRPNRLRASGLVGFGGRLRLHENRRYRRISWAARRLPLLRKAPLHDRGIVQE